MPIMLWGWNSEKLSRLYKGDELLVWWECITPPNDIIFYYPLKWDIKDYSWNWYDLTKRNWNLSYNDNTYITVSWSIELINSSSALAVNMNNDSYTFACTLRNFPTDYWNRWYQPSAWLCLEYFTGTPQWVKWIWTIANWWNNSWSSSDRSHRWEVYPECRWWWNSNFTWVFVTWNQWKKLIYTYNKNTNEKKIYLENNAFFSITESTKNSWTWVVLFNRPYGNYDASSRFYHWDAKNFILTKWVWTQEDFDWYLWLE